MRFASSSFIGVAALFVTPAQADWQYTRWGMTPAQVATASTGTVKAGPGDPREEYASAKIGATGKYASGSFNFLATFYFNNDKLIDVRLSLTGEDLQGNGYKLKNSLDGVYGKPFSETRGLLSIITYHDTGKNNRIDLIMIGNRSTTLEYRPLRDNDAFGL